MIVRVWLTLRLTAARRPRRGATPVYQDHRPSTGLPEAEGGAVAVEPVARRHVVPLGLYYGHTKSRQRGQSRAPRSLVRTQTWGPDACTVAHQAINVPVAAVPIRWEYPD